MAVTRHRRREFVSEQVAIHGSTVFHHTLYTHEHPKVLEAINEAWGIVNAHRPAAPGLDRLFEFPFVESVAFALIKREGYPIEELNEAVDDAYLNEENIADVFGRFDK